LLILLSIEINHFKVEMTMAVFDDAGSTAPHQLEPLTYTFRAALEAHASNAAYLVPTPNSTDATSAIETFHHNNNLWEAAITAKRLRHGLRIKLDGFFLFEWFPRSPGLYWTPHGKTARQDAKHRIIQTGPNLVVYDPYPFRIP
jgi:hypothetical protein